MSVALSAGLAKPPGLAPERHMKRRFSAIVAQGLGGKPIQVPLHPESLWFSSRVGVDAVAN